MASRQHDLFIPPPAAGSVLHVVALSGGKDSTAMALRLRELNPSTPYVYVITPTGDELPEMFAHWRSLSERLGTPLTPIIHQRGLDGLIADMNALPNWRQRWCTRLLKIEPYAAWLMQQSERFERVISYVGLRADEDEREGGDYAEVPGIEMVFPMREWGWSIDEVLGFLAEQGVTIPARTDCAKCFYQKLIEWWTLWRDHPDLFADGIAWEDRTGHTFRSPGRDTWPADLRSLGARFAAGDIPKSRADPINAMKCRVCRT